MTSFPPSSAGLALLLMVAAAVIQFTLVTGFTPVPLVKSPRASFLVVKPLFGLEEELEGEVEASGEALASEFYELERGKGLTAKDIEDLENDDLDPQNLVVREDIDEVTGEKIVDYEFSEDEDYSDNRSID